MWSCEGGPGGGGGGIRSVGCLLEINLVNSQPEKTINPFVSLWVLEGGSQRILGWPQKQA